MNVDTTESLTAVGLLTALSDNDTPPPGSSSSGLATLHAKTSVKLVRLIDLFKPVNCRGRTHPSMAPCHHVTERGLRVCLCVFALQLSAAEVHSIASRMRAGLQIADR
jgi:hypothetical protein